MLKSHIFLVFMSNKLFGNLSSFPIAFLCFWRLYFILDYEGEKFYYAESCEKLQVIEDYYHYYNLIKKVYKTTLEA